MWNSRRAGRIYPGTDFCIWSYNEISEIMENDELKVLHVDDAIDWRGGQQQAFYLFSEMQKRGYKTEMLCQPGSLLDERCRKNNLPLHTVRMRNELDFIAAWKIARYCKKHGFTVFHAHTAHALSLGIMVKMLNAPITLFASRRVDFSTRKTAMSVWKYNNRHLKDNLYFQRNQKCTHKRRYKC